MTEKPELKKLVENWLAIAKEDFRCANESIKSTQPSYHTICFLCQATAEKYIKAYLISQGWQLKKIHDLTELVGFAIGYDKDFTEILPQASILDDYIEAGRYPGDLSFESIDENKAKEAIEAADKVEKFVLGKLINLDESK